MAEYSCNSKECDGRVFEAHSNTGRCIHCGSEDIERLDRPWLVPTIIVSGLIIAIGALGWWRVALDEQGRESLRNFQLSGCKDMTACNFAPAALMDDAASCTYDDELRDCNGTCKEDADGDGVCDSQEILGCIDEAACNFDKNATEEELICEYPEPGFTCAGDCVNDKDGDGICDENEVLGCTDSSACNFDADATEPDGSCWYREVGKSCEEGFSNHQNEGNGARTSDCKPISFQGYTYDVVKIGSDCWLAENLMVQSNSNGTGLKRFFDVSSSSIATQFDAYYQKGEKYAYNYEAAQKVCPSGWHIPTYNEWNTALKSNARLALDLSPTKFPGLIIEWKCDYWLPEGQSASKPYGEGIRFEGADQSKSLKATFPKNTFLSVRCVRS